MLELNQGSIFYMWVGKNIGLCGKVENFSKKNLPFLFENAFTYSNAIWKIYDFKSICNIVFIKTKEV